LQRAMEDYNLLVGTLERRVLVTARRMRDLDLVDSDLEPVGAVDATPRLLTASELLGGELGVLGQLEDDLEGLSAAPPGRP